MKKIVKRMHWKALFSLKEEEKYKPLVEDVEFYEKEETYGFKPLRKPPPIKEIELFEKEFFPQHIIVLTNEFSTKLLSKINVKN